MRGRQETDNERREWEQGDARARERTVPQRSHDSEILVRDTGGGGARKEGKEERTVLQVRPAALCFSQSTILYGAGEVRAIGPKLSSISFHWATVANICAGKEGRRKGGRRATGEGNQSRHRPE